MIEKTSFTVTIKNEIANNNIEKFTLRKSFQKLENIKKKIKSDNKDIIDFIEIERKGMIYIVKVTEKVYERKRYLV